MPKMFVWNSIRIPMMRRLMLLLCCMLLSPDPRADLSGIEVGIDPGHGGGDPGAIAFDLNEKDLNLVTALALKDYLEADGAKVVMTRDTDISVTSAVSGKTELVARANFFNSQGVDYMISVHHNSAFNSAANGVLAYIARGVCPYRSGKMAGEVVPRILESTGLKPMGGANGTPCSGRPGVFEWNATVVAETYMPALLAEISFMSHPEEAERLQDPAYLRRNGWALYAGFVDYLGRTPLPFVEETAKPELHLPVDESEGLSPFGVDFEWDLMSPPAMIDAVRFSLAETDGYGVVPDEPVYLGACAGLALSSNDTQLPSSECGTLKAGQWYYWRLEVEGRTQTAARAWFKTGELELKDADGTETTDRVSFGDVTLGEEAERTLHLYNRGQREYQPHFKLQDEAAGFRAEHDCPVLLDEDADCVVKLYFAPVTAGAQSAQLELYHGQSALGNLLVRLTLEGSGSEATTEPEQPEQPSTEPEQPDEPEVPPPPAPGSFELNLGAERKIRVQAISVGEQAEYTWQTSDGQQASGAQAEFTFAAAGSYSVTLLVRGADGSEHTSTRTVELGEHALLCENGACSVGDGSPASCTATVLREALEQGGEISFACGAAMHTITLDDDLHVRKDTHLKGGGGSQGGLVTLNGAGRTRILYNHSQVKLEVSNLTFKNGREPGNEGAGGAIYADTSSTLRVRACRFDNNDGSNGAWEGGGGAITVKSFSATEIDSSLFINNKGLNGAAIHSLLSSLKVRNSAFIGNNTLAGADHGGGYGAAIYVDGAGDNLDQVAGEILIQASTFNNNQGAGLGGALFSFLYPPDKLIVEETTFSRNRVDFDNMGNAGGGAIWHGNGLFELRLSTFYENLARSQGGALWLDGSHAAQIQNTTFAANRALMDAAEGFGGIGGAITGNGNFTCNHCTFMDNRAGLAGGAIYGNLKVTLSNSLFADNSAANDGAAIQYYQTCAGIMQDGGGNLQYPGPNPAYGSDTPCVYQVRVADPELDPLANYGGFTRTAALTAGSPAIDTGKPDVCAEIDQRRVERPVDGNGDGSALCDSGAFEFDRRTFTGNGLGYDLESGDAVEVMAHFEPLVATEDGRQGNGLSVTQEDLVSVAVALRADPAHVGRDVQILVATLYTPTDATMPMWFMRNAGIWEVWNGRLEHLAAAETRTLQAEETFTVFHGQFANLPGEFSIYVGYRVEGLMVFNAGDPLRLKVR